MEQIHNKYTFRDKGIKNSLGYSTQGLFCVYRQSGKWSNIKKTKGFHKLKNKIIKLRTYFQNLSLENQIHMENSNNIRPKVFKKYLEKSRDFYNENEIIEHEMAFYINKSTVDEENLLLKNDHDFRLIPKRNFNNLQDENICNNHRNILKTHGKLQKSTNYCHNTAERTEDLQIPRTTCTERKDGNSINSNESQPINEYKHDLQSLLIMMTINSTTDKNREDEPNEVLCTEQFEIEYKNNDSKIKSNFQIDIENNQTEDLVRLLNITSLGKESSSNQKRIAKKAIEKWKAFVAINKENQVQEQRQKTLNNFFDNLSKKVKNTVARNEPIQKAKMLVRDYDTYQHRFNIQKHIIALQKAKLEQQNKVIEQLKYNKIIEASRQSLDTMREDVRKTYYEIDKHLKPKIKCLSNELKIRDFEEPSLVLHCLKVPQFLQRMEARARQREEKHAIIRERRKQMEEERIRLKQQAELAKAEMDKEEKIRRIKELRNKRKKEKIENIRKKQYAERMRAMIVMADLHYERNLMNKYGIRPLKLLMEIKKDNVEKAKTHYKFQLLKNVFLHWMWYTEDMLLERSYRAESFYRKKILIKMFNGLKKNHYNYLLKKQVAEDYYDLYVTQLVFRKFCAAVAISKKENEVKRIKATVYYNSNILFKTFTCWRSLPALNALKREQDARKLKWREKVLLVVPDYKPPED